MVLVRVLTSQRNIQYFWLPLVILWISTAQDLSLLPFQVRPQAAGIRRSVQTYPEEEGKDHQEAGPQAGVYWVPVEKPGNLAEN